MYSITDRNLAVSAMQLLGCGRPRAGIRRSALGQTAVDWPAACVADTLLCAAAEGGPGSAIYRLPANTSVYILPVDIGVGCVCARTVAAAQ
jgi:hypothetical protein